MTQDEQDLGEHFTALSVLLDVVGRLLLPVLAHRGALRRDGTVVHALGGYALRVERVDGGVADLLVALRFQVLPLLRVGAGCLREHEPAERVGRVRRCADGGHVRHDVGTLPDGQRRGEYPLAGVQFQPVVERPLGVRRGLFVAADSHVLQPLRVDRRQLPDVIQLLVAERLTPHHPPFQGLPQPGGPLDHPLLGPPGAGCEDVRLGTRLGRVLLDRLAEPGDDLLALRVRLLRRSGCLGALLLAGSRALDRGGPADGALHGLTVPTPLLLVPAAHHLQHHLVAAAGLHPHQPGGCGRACGLLLAGRRDGTLPVMGFHGRPSAETGCP